MVTITEDDWWTIFGAGLAIVGCLFQAVGFIMQKIGHNKIERFNNKVTKRLSRLNSPQSKNNQTASYDADLDIFTADDATESLKNSMELQTPPKRRNVGLRKSLSPQPNGRSLKKRNYLQSKMWLLGFFINGIIGSLLNIIALNYAPQSVVLPLSATTLVGNTVLATTYLGEPFPIQDFMGVVLVVLGSIGTIIVGPKESHNASLSVVDLHRRWIAPSFLLFFGVVSVVIVVDAVAERVLRTINLQRRAALVERGISEWEGQEMGDHTIVSNAGFFLISYPLIAAYFASINFLVLKSFVKVVDASIKDHAQWDVIAVYVAGIIAINFLLELHRQKGLRAFGAVYVIPIYQVLVITLGTTMGAVFYEEMKNMKPLHLTLFVISVLVTCCGVTILALSKKIGKLRYDCRRYLLTLNDSSDSEMHGKDYNPTSMVAAPSAQNCHVSVGSMHLVSSRSCTPNPMELEMDNDCDLEIQI